MSHHDEKRVRFAVVGLGHISQVAVLPGFQNAPHAELAALVSSDDQKLAELGKRYGVDRRVHYDDLPHLLDSGDVDALYIGTPNHLHHEQVLLAAEHGVHVLCEKPMAIDEDQCREMVEACDEAGVRLMIAYRLHFERTNLEAIAVARSGHLGELRIFDSAFTQQVTDEDNIRLLPLEEGGGTVFDMGVYCINAARYLFAAEPYEVTAVSTHRYDDMRFAKADEMTSVIMRFPEDRIATFTSSFGASRVSRYHLIGARGELRVEPAFEYAGRLSYEARINGVVARHTYPKRDQFGAELSYFSECILNDTQPEPDGYEGWADVRVVNAIHRSAREGHPVSLGPFDVPSRPGLDQVIDKPGVDEPPEINATGP